MRLIKYLQIVFSVCDVNGVYVAVCMYVSPYYRTEVLVCYVCSFTKKHLKNPVLCDAM